MDTKQPTDQLLHTIDYATDRIVELNLTAMRRPLSPLEAVRLRDYRREIFEANQQLGPLYVQLPVSRRKALHSNLRRAGNIGLMCLSWIGASNMVAWPFVPGFRPKDDNSSA